jgi:hypothetical protein
MTDIAEKLRALAGNHPDGELHREAADEIERLRGRVAELELTGDRKELQAMLDQLGEDFERMRDRAIHAEGNK